MKHPVQPAVERFWAKVEKGPACWIWTAHRNANGYGQLFVKRGFSTVLAHRYSYELHHGPILDGLQIDHLCRVKQCVNPAHLEAVTPRVNALRGVAPTVQVYWSGCCARGHERNAKNTYVNPSNGKRDCRVCRRMRWGMDDRTRSYRQGGKAL